MAEIEPEELAKLARLRLPTETGSRTTEEIQQLLRYFAMLQDVNTEGIEPSAYPLPSDARLRADLPAAPLPREEVLRNAPQQQAGCFLVPRVIEG